MEDTPTLHDVARLAGVSIATVSNVINNSKHVTSEMRARVERAIAQTGYVPNEAARALANHRRRERSDRPGRGSTGR